MTSIAFAPDISATRRDKLCETCGAGALVSDCGATAPGLQTIAAELSQIKGYCDRPDSTLACGKSRYAMMIAGSGTTGAPKVIAVAFDAVINSAPSESAIWGLKRGSVTLSLVQPWLSSVPLRAFNAFYRGGAFHIWTPSTANPFDLMERVGVNKIFAAVVQAEHFLDLAERFGRRFPNEAELTVYASVVTDGLVNRIKEKLTSRVSVVYGSNELGVVADIDLASNERPAGSVGRISQGTQVEIVDKNDNPLPVGEVGLVRARAPRLFSEYVGAPEETAKALRHGWFYPGDVGRLTPDRHLILLGRSDQVMIFSGLNIHPAEIENAMSMHPSITDVAVMPMVHTVYGDVPICAVVLAPGHAVADSELRNFATEHLDQRSPGKILVLDRIPRNDHGKVVRKELKEILQGRLLDDNEPTGN